METRTDEIGDGLYRISVFVPEIAPPAGFTFNHFLLAGDGAGALADLAGHYDARLRAALAHEP